MKYFEGVRVFAVPIPPFSCRSCAVTLPGVGILCSPSLVDNVYLLRHEFGHILQRRYFGWWFFWFKVAPVSLWSAVKAALHGGKSFYHCDTWTEWSANRLSFAYFHQPADWPDWRFPRMACHQRKGTQFPVA
ncbi:MAG: hypothetical protein MJZ23_01555 [Paludibacteraceae bacterium]|nr:hypothetical protein [Paludibacteraceae bacterium]